MKYTLGIRTKEDRIIDIGEGNVFANMGFIWFMDSNGKAVYVVPANEVTAIEVLAD